MIATLFQFGGEVIEVRIEDTNCLFRTKATSGGFAPIEGLKLSKSGSIKEHPDLKDRDDWEEESRKRFKNKLKELKTEKERMKYIINDLSKHGYKAVYMQQQGFRPIKIKQTNK